MEILGITLTAWSALVVTISAAVMAGTMFVIGTNRLHFIWAAFCLAVVVYAAGFFMVAWAKNPDGAQFWWRIDYIGTILIPFIFFHFVLEFLKLARRRIIVFLYGISVILLLINLSTNLIIDRVTFMFGELYYNSPPGPLHPLIIVVYVILITYAHYLLVKTYRATTEATIRTQIRLFFIATSVGFLGGIMNFIAVYGIPLHPATQLTILVAMPLIGFAILRYRLFGVRAVWAQFFAFILSSFALVQLILSQSREAFIFNVLLFIFVLVIGIYLVKSVRKELEIREKIEKLAADLKKANTRLQELDRQKSEFVSIASHQLKSPLTAIKGYASLLLEESFGRLSVKSKEPVQRIFESSVRLVNVIEDFLNITRIEQGRMKFEFQNTDLLAMIRDIIKEFTPTIERSGLTIAIRADEEKTYTVSADVSKLRQVLSNLTDNAIKYTPKGKIDIELTKDDIGGMIILCVRDTGIGFSPETKVILFQKFGRGDGVEKLHTEGSGIGLYIAREIIRAHKGHIRAESEGLGKGSMFCVELPEG